MSKNFGVLKYNIGTLVGDTTSAFGSAIGTYINNRYKDILRRSNWNVINHDYVLSATSASASYSLPANFGKELYVYDQVRTVDIPYIGIEKLEQEYQDLKNDSGTVEGYSIFNTTTDLTEPSAARVKKIKFFRGIGTSACFEIPHTIYPLDMSASSEIPVLECERAIEYGACSDASMAKRQFGKAQYFEQLYEKEIQMLMFNQGNQPNELPMMNALALSRDEGI